MSTRGMVVRCVAAVFALILVALAIHIDVKFTVERAMAGQEDVQSIVDRAMAKQERKDIRLWKPRLLRLYEEMGIDYPKDPRTRSELFGPLLEMIETMGE